MRENVKNKNFKFYGNINKKYRNIIFIFILLLAAVSTILAIKALMQPLTIEERIITNTIEEKTSFDYEAVVKPSNLYPNGGIVKPGQVIFTNLTDDFIINLNASIESEKPVKVESKTEISYNIAAEKMWERNFVLKPEKSIITEGVKNNLVDENIHININEILNFITLVEEETKVRPNNQIIIKQIITGTVYDENNNIIKEINNELLIPFDISEQYVKYAGENDNKEFIDSKVIEEIKLIPQTFNIFNLNLLLKESKIGFCIAAIIFILLTIIYILENLLNKKESLSKTGILEKKNKSKIININKEINLDSIECIILSDFNDLLKISEEKEEMIFKYVKNSIYNYYLINSSCIYMYKSINDEKECEVIKNV